MSDSAAPEKATTWTRAYVLGIGIAVYFLVATVWLPSFVLKLSFVASAPSVVRDLVGAGVWFLFLAAGLVGLRLAQRGRWI